MKVGLRRIGISDNFIHVDMDYDKPQKLIWTINNKIWNFSEHWVELGCLITLGSTYTALAATKDDEILDYKACIQCYSIR